MLVTSAFASEVLSNGACTTEECNDQNSLLQHKVDTTMAIDDSVTVENESQLFELMQKMLNEGAPWTLDYAKFSDTMTMTCKVTIDGKDMSEGTLGAFVGNEVRGLAKPPSRAIPFGPNKGKKLYLITLYADTSGEDLTFKYFLDGKIIDLSTSLKFKVNGNVGNIFWPKSLTGSAPAMVQLDPPATAPTAGDWTINKHKYPNSETFTSRVIVGGTAQKDGKLAAFKGDEIVGLEEKTLTPPPFFPPPVRKPAFFLMVYGEAAGPAITFKYKSKTGDIIPLHACGTAGKEETVEFVPNGIHGNIFKPYIFKDVAC